LSRYVSWFSHGAASAVATKLLLGEGHGDVHVVLTETNSEHPDNVRFRRECEGWFGQQVETIASDKFRDTWDVWEKSKFLVSPHGAPCTGLLKKVPRYAYQRPDDIQVFGFTADRPDARRADRFRAANPEVNLYTPLIERGLTKADCLGILDKAGIEIPEMYRLGYRNNNCIGCVKGGMGYWNKIRVDFPDVFDRMADLEQRLGATVLREPDPSGVLNAAGRVRSIPLPLASLAPGRGRYADESDIECGLLCTAVSEELDVCDD
jgi:hypothetical protein